MVYPTNFNEAASRSAQSFFHLVNRLESKWTDNRAINMVLVQNIGNTLVSIHR